VIASAGASPTDGAWRRRYGARRAGRQHGYALHAHPSKRRSIDNIKQRLIKGSERDTLLIFRTLHNTGRVFKNVISEEVVSIERRPGGCSFDDLRPLVMGARGRAALESGNVDDGLIWASMAIGLMDDIPPCAELLERMVRECRERLAQATHWALG
jgi:NAD(P)H-dependent flavin oxidoreductase YrpB (nitropropane dioxygenase family)